MRLLILFLTIVTLEAFAQVGQLTTIEIPQLRAVGKNQMDFVPKSWKVLKSVKGELNGDNHADYVMILGLKNEVLLKNDIDTFRNEVPRLLVMLVSQKNKLTVDIQTYKIILPSAFGGNFDPIEFNEPLTIRDQDKSVTISMYGGLRERWSIDYTFKKINNDWLLVAADKRTYDSTSPEESGYSYTFDFEKKETKNNKTGETHKLNWDKPLKLKDVEPFENEILPDIRI